MLSLLQQAVYRLDLLYEPDTTAPLLQEDEDILARRAAGAKRIGLKEGLTAYCIRIVLDPKTLEDNAVDVGDVQEEIRVYYPSRLEILRSVSSTTTHASSPRLRLRPTRDWTDKNRYPHTDPASFNSFLADLRESCSQAPRRQHSKSEEASRATLEDFTKAFDDFFQLLHQLTWHQSSVLVSAARPQPKSAPRVVSSTDPTIKETFAKLVYNSQTGTLEQGHPCVGCSNLFPLYKLPEEGIAKGYCPGCFKLKFNRCALCAHAFALEDTFVAPCQCSYCGPCLDMFFAARLTRTDFPPKCHGQELHIFSCRKYLSESTMRRYAQLMDLFNDNIQLLCGNESCEQYIRPGRIRDRWGMCEKCLSWTCQECRLLSEAHQHTAQGGRICPREHVLPVGSLTPTSTIGTQASNASSEMPMVVSHSPPSNPTIRKDSGLSQPHPRERLSTLTVPSHSVLQLRPASKQESNSSVTENFAIPANASNESKGKSFGAKFKKKFKTASLAHNHGSEGSW